MTMAEDIKTLNAALIVGQRLKGEEERIKRYMLKDDARKALQLLDFKHLLS